MYTQVVVLALLLTGSVYVCQAQCYANLNQEVVTTYPQCANKPGASETAPFETLLRDLICDATCGPLYNATFYRLCPSPSVTALLLVEYYLAQCRVNANGQACYSFYNDSDIDMSVANNEALQLCSSSAQGACTDQCRARLMAISSYYGTCINSVFNSSYFRTFYELVPLFSYQLWTNCQVPVPVIGGGETVTTGPNDGMQSTSSAMTVVCLKIAIILAMILIFLTNSLI